MNCQALVSIIINNYNYGRFLSGAIESALNQTYPHTEVIVVDDGSIDNSREIIASYTSILPVLKENGGQASAFNAGFAASIGDIICFLDADDLFLPEKVAEVVKTLKDYQQSSWCFHPLKLVDTDIKPLENNNYPGLVYECDLRLDIKRGGLRGSKLPFAIPGTSGLCFTRSLLQQILPMPEAEAIALNDSYVQFTAISLGKGFALAKELSLQRVHNDNAYTLKANKQRLVAKINILTAYWMRTNFPSLYKFTDKLFAAGIATYWRTGDVETTSKEVIKKYWASSVLPLEKLNIITRVLYYSLRI